MNDEEFEEYRVQAAKTLRVLLGIVVVLLTAAVTTAIYTNK